MKRLSQFTAIAATCSLLVLPAVGSAAAAGSSATYSGRPGSATRVMSASSISSFPTVKSAFRNQGPLMFTPIGRRAAAAAKVGLSANAAAASPQSRDGSGVTHRFNGLSDKDSDALNGFAITPPDQGLCVGYDTTLPGHPKAVWEPINLAARETTVGGTRLRPDVNLATLFQDPYSEGDVRCLYDAQTRSFYFTEIGFPVATGPAADDNNTTVDVVVMNAHGVAAYQYDTSLGGPSAGDCFGDQPKTGFDNDALVISTDEYCGPTESNYLGAIALVISKSQLVNESATVNDAVIGPVSLAGDPVVGLDPAISTGSSTGYFVNSVPFLADGSNNPVGHTLGVWSLHNSRAVTTGHGTVTLVGNSIPSEPYAFPVPAPSTGNGSTHTYDGSVITSESTLQADDGRLSGPVEVTSNGRGGVQLWTALDAAVTSSGGSHARDAAAWFAVDPKQPRVSAQGYVVAPDTASLLYPAVGTGGRGAPAMTFTITSPTLNPSAAYTTLGSGRIDIVAVGSGAHQSFSDAPPYSTARWGDYSFAQADPDGTGIWLATEYIPPASDQDPSDNWGTYLWEVNGR
jgi:hypothetical protein